MKPKTFDELSIYTIRALCIDMINKSNSGHPGMPLGSAPILHTLFTRHLNINKNEPNWMNRDRFVLSAGHASALLYSLLFLNGYLKLDDLKAFRQLNSLTPGHPENKHTPGVDATTGPLGQGIAQAVGMALASEAIKGEYPEGHLLQDHYTYALSGDGCLFEGVSQEAISFAGLHQLNKLILFYDANNVTLDGSLDLSFNEDVAKRFESANWNVLHVANGNDVEAIDQAIIKAKASQEKPTLIIVKTIIGYGSQKEGKNAVHGNPLGKDDGIHAKTRYIQEMSEEARSLLVSQKGHDQEFFVLSEVLNETLRLQQEHGQRKYQEEVGRLEKYAAKHPKAFATYLNLMKLDVNSFLKKKAMTFEAGSSISTRNASQAVLNEIKKSVPHLIGGSADVASSVMTKLTNGSNFMPSNLKGENINWGIREFGMAAMQNGMLLHGGVRTYVGSFLVFSDYMKSAVRHAALSHLPAIYLFSHDSLAVGEDGPTHQPVEHLVMLRSIPFMRVIRPADANETYGAWKIALASIDEPTSLILSRQNLPLLANSSAAKVELGGYIVSREAKKADLIIIATGSEVSLALESQKQLLAQGVDVRVVSMPSIELFKKQSQAYQDKVIGKKYQKRVAIEMLSPMCWYEFAPHVYGINKFGTSAKASDAMNAYHFNPESFTAYLLKIKEGK